MYIESYSDKIAAYSILITKIAKSPDLPLSASEKRANMIDGYNDVIVISTVNFLFMSDWGCIHRRSEWYLQSKGVIFTWDRSEERPM